MTRGVPAVHFHHARNAFGQCYLMANSGMGSFVWQMECPLLVVGVVTVPTEPVGDNTQPEYIGLILGWIVTNVKLMRTRCNFLAS